MQNAMKRNGLYRTSDLYVAAWLLTKGFELQNIDRSSQIGKIGQSLFTNSYVDGL